MKKYTLITVLLFFTALNLHADETTIIVNNVNLNTRSITQNPFATISDTDILTVSFDASGMYSLYVEDSFGALVYTSTLPADGMEYDYDLSGPSGEYEGYFTIRD